MSALIPFVQSLADLLFPRLCPVCGKSLVTGERFLCVTCLADFPFVNGSYGLETDIPGLSGDHVQPERMHSLFYYNKYNNYKNLIYAVKFHSRADLGVYLGHMLGERMAGHCIADCIVPVPLHRKRERQRGLNQAFQIARGVQQVLGLEMLDDVMVRVKNNVSQTGKNACERRTNVAGVFELRKPASVRGRHVLLLDDVITTGATIGSCMQVLAGAGKVSFSLACLARTEI